MKLKSYLRGLGLGMIVTTIILVIAFKARNHEMTDQEIISRAHELGMVETSLYADGSTQEETDGAVNVPEETTAGEESGEGKTEPESTTEAVPPQETTTQETTAEEINETTAEQKQEETTTREPASAEKTETTAAGKEIVIVFENISSADKASKLLYDAGVIQDIDSFNEYLSDNGYARKITEGEFTFTTGMSFEEIARIITRSR